MEELCTSMFTAAQFSKPKTQTHSRYPPRIGYKKCEIYYGIPFPHKEQSSAVSCNEISVIENVYA